MNCKYIAMIAAVFAVLAAAVAFAPADETDAATVDINVDVAEFEGEYYVDITVPSEYTGNANVLMKYSGTEIYNKEGGIVNGHITIPFTREITKEGLTVDVTFSNGDTASWSGSTPAPVVTLESIEITTTPDKTTYTEGEVLDLTGMVVTATYSNGESAPVTGYTTSPATGTELTVGTNSVTVSYTEGGVTMTADFAVTVNAAVIPTKTLESIEITTTPDKTTYTEGEVLDLTGMVVTATYSNGESAPVTGYTTSPATGTELTVGTNSVTVSYTEGGVTMTADFAVTVNAVDDPAERPFTNTITLGDGAVVDADSLINASYTQEVVIAGDVTIVKGGYMVISGKLTIQADATLTVAEGGWIIIGKDGIVDVQGDLVAEAGSADDPTFTYSGCLMTVSGNVTLEGAHSFATAATAKGITVSGIFEVGDEASAVLDGATVAEGGELVVNGVVTGAIVNNGTVTIDSQGLATKESVDMTIQIGAAGTVDVINVYGTVLVSDSELTFDEKKDKVPAEYNSSVSLQNVAGVVVTETLVIEKKDGKNVGVNTMFVTGTVAVADDYISSVDITGSVTVGGENVEIAEDVVIGKDVSLNVIGTLEVSGNLTVVDGAFTGTSDEPAPGTMTVTGKVTSKAEAYIAVINAAVYETSSPATFVYTTLETALADGATAITLMGENTVSGEATIPVGTTVGMEADSELTVDEDAVLAIASDDRKSGKLNTGADAFDTVIVDGTLVAQNFAKSGIGKDAVLSDTTKAVDDAVTYTNVYNALENATEGETVKITRGAELKLDRDVEIRTGVTLEIPNGENVVVDHGVTVTVNGTVKIGSTAVYTISEEVKDNPDTSADESKAAGATVVNGMFLVADETLAEKFIDQIVGAYFGYTVDKVDYIAIAPLATAAALADDIISEEIVLFGDMELGDIDFSAYDGEDILVGLIVMGDVSIQNITIGNVMLYLSNTASFTGTVVMENGDVSLTDIADLMFVNETDPVEETVTSVVYGGAFVIQDDKNSVEETGTVVFGGEIVLGTTENGFTTCKHITVDIPADADVTVENGKFTGAVTVGGTMTVSGNNITFEVLTVTGTVDSEDKCVASAKKLFVGMTAEDYAMAGTGTVSGVTLTRDAGSVAYVSPNATVAEEIVKDLKSTAYYVAEDLYLTAYAIENNNVEINDAKFTVTDARFDGWQYDDNGTLKAIDANAVVGKHAAVYADIDYAIYNVTVTADAGIGSVSIDGVVLANMGGNVFVIEGLVAGQHTIGYTLKPGFEGQPALTVNGQAVSGMTFSLSGNPAEGDDYVDVSLSLAGTTPSESTPIIIENDGDEGLGLTDYLLIVLVVLIVIMAIIVAMRLMRS